MKVSSTARSARPDSSCDRARSFETLVPLRANRHPSQQLLAHAGLPSRWRALSLRILTYVNMGTAGTRVLFSF